MHKLTHQYTIVIIFTQQWIKKAKCKKQNKSIREKSQTRIQLFVIELITELVRLAGAASSSSTQKHENSLNFLAFCEKIYANTRKNVHLKFKLYLNQIYSRILCIFNDLTDCTPYRYVACEMVWDEQTYEIGWNAKSIEKHKFFCWLTHYDNNCWFICRTERQTPKYDSLKIGIYFKKPHEKSLTKISTRRQTWICKLMRCISPKSQH